MVAIPSVYYNALKLILPKPAEESASDDNPSEADAELLNTADINDYQD